MAVQGFTGFDTGDASQLAALGASHTIQNTRKRTGDYALKVPSNTSSTTTLFTGASFSEVVIRDYIYIDYLGDPAGTADSSSLVSMLTAASAEIAYFDFVKSGAGDFLLRVINAVTASQIGSSVTITPGVWHRLELYLLISASVGVITGKMDDAIVASGTGLNTGSTNVGGISLAGGCSLSSVADVYHDDALWRDDSTFPGPGRSIARQGKAGTPNADAWTKTSGQTAAQVWSENPFSATNEAHSTAASQAQTMLVADVGAGTDPIPDGSIINACSVGAIMKEISSGTTRTYSIRRRVAGSNTDTAKVLTASDAYYNDGIWTASRADLQSAEIGGVRGTGTGKAVQIEDCWLFVDYSPPVQQFFPRRVG